MLTKDADLKRMLLQKPIDPDAIFKILNEQLDYAKNEASNLERKRILVVDDNKSFVLALREPVDPWRLDLYSLSIPKDFWEQLNQIMSELNDRDWSKIPILFLIAHPDPHTLEQVFQAGEDDFVGKPIVGPELITHIFNHLERTELLRRAQGRNFP
ncbi:response regulator [Thermostichus sp. MS-CIW-15]